MKLPYWEFSIRPGCTVLMGNVHSQLGLVGKLQFHHVSRCVYPFYNATSDSEIAEHTSKRGIMNSRLRNNKIFG